MIVSIGRTSYRFGTVKPDLQAMILGNGLSEMMGWATANPATHGAAAALEAELQAKLHNPRILRRRDSAEC